jgi:hypothetical protein
MGISGRPPGDRRVRLPPAPLYLPIQGTRNSISGLSHPTLIESVYLPFLSAVAFFLGVHYDQTISIQR